MMFGGAYESWILKELGRDPAMEPRSPRVEKLAVELETLRRAVFESIEWIAFYERDSARLRKDGKREEKIDRSVFARIAQKTENDVLTVMRRYLTENGWTALTLCFDGLIVQERPGRTLDLEALNARILRETGFHLEVVEKPLYSETFPTLSLKRFG